MRWPDFIARLMRAATSRQAFRVAYGRSPNSGELRQLAQIGNSVSRAGKLRSIIALFDRQTYPTPITVRFTADDIETTDIGPFKLVLDKHDISVSRSIIASKDYEPHVRAFVEKTLKRGMTAIDIGANVGFYTMLCASIVGDAGKVFAFEPNSENCRLILLSLSANGFANVKLYAFALSNVVGTAFFSPAIGSNGILMPFAQESIAHPNCTVVATVRLDDLIKEPTHLIKADVEGAEYLALSGGKALIEKYRPTIVAEFSLDMLQHVSGITGAEFLRWMKSLSYRPFILRRVDASMVEITDVDDFVSTWGHWARIEDIAFVPQ